MNTVQNIHRYFIVCITLLLFFPLFINAQTTVPFEKRYESSGIFGDLTMIGNSIMGPWSDVPFNMSGLNDNLNMVFVDIDNDPTTFSSSSATFTTSPCNRVVYAGLYWGARFAPTTPAPNEVKFKIPGGTYQDLTADANLDLIYYKDVTDIVTTNMNASGEYFVANVSSALGKANSAGWTLVIVYEDPSESRKYISTFDGFSAVGDAPFNQVDFNYSGFVTPPTGPVEGRIGVAALEGDFYLSGDHMLFKADSNSTFTYLSDAENPEDNFFNSKITENGFIVSDRNLNSTNTLGWDQKLLSITDLNSGNSLIGNNETGATVRVSNNTGASRDHIFTFLNTLAINIIEPFFQVLTSVEDDLGNAITHQSPVPLGATVWYTINFQNIGTDNAQNSYILNTLPINVILDESSIELPVGVTYTFNPVTRELRFDIADELVEKENFSTSHNIRYKVVASNDCFDYTDACTNILVNSIMSYYDGENSGQNVSGQPGLNGINGCGLGNIGSMDLYVITSSCQYNSVAQFCNDTIFISGHDGYTEYEWIDQNGMTVGNEQLLEVDGPGVYTAIQIKTGCTVTIRIITVLGLDVTFTPDDALCKDSEDGKINIQVNEASSNYTYELFQNGNLLESEGPIISDNHVFSELAIGTYEAKVTNADGCYDLQTFVISEPSLLEANNIVLDNIMPCNGNVLTGRIEIGASGGTPGYEYSIDNGASYQSVNIFEVTTEGSHVITVRDANQCTTTTTAIIDFDEEIQYNITTEDVVCLGYTDGSATVNITNNSAGNIFYYSIDGGASFQTFPIFSGLAKGNYEIIIRKVKGANTCETIENVVIDQLVDLNFTARTEFSCEGSSNQIIASVDPQYANEVTYTLDDTIEQVTGFFEDVADGEHTLTVEHNSTGCEDEPITITVHAYNPVDIEDLEESGINEYTVIATNGEPQYEYAMNDENDFNSSNIFNITSSGTYVFYVRDTTGCVVERSFELEFLDIVIPNFFTPDGDGINDTWFPRNIDIYPKITVAIFDRYQRLIANYIGNRATWDGYYNNKLLPSGDYWYIVKLNQPDDHREFKGNFTLYR